MDDEIGQVNSDLGLVRVLDCAVKGTELYLLYVRSLRGEPRPIPTYSCRAMGMLYRVEIKMVGVALVPILCVVIYVF